MWFYMRLRLVQKLHYVIHYTHAVFHVVRCDRGLSMRGMNERPPSLHAAL